MNDDEIRNLYIRYKKYIYETGRFHNVFSILESDSKRDILKIKDFFHYIFERYESRKLHTRNYYELDMKLTLLGY